MPPEDHPEERAYLLLRKLLSLNTALAISAFLLTACAPLKTAASPPGVSGQTHELSIAAASNLSFAFLELVEQFEEETGGKVRLSLGSSGNLYAQIINGAPFDIFFAADKAYPLRLEEAGRTQPGSFYVYATGGIAVWVPESSPIDVERTRHESAAAPIGPEDRHRQPSPGPLWPGRAVGYATLWRLPKGAGTSSCWEIPPARPHSSWGQERRASALSPSPWCEPLAYTRGQLLGGPTRDLPETAASGRPPQGCTESPRGRKVHRLSQTTGRCRHHAALWF